MNKEPRIFCGRATHKLAKAVCGQLGVFLGDLDIEIFADQEPWYRVPSEQGLKGQNVFVIQSTSEPAQITYFDLFGIMDAVRRQKPKKLVVIMPFFGFRRQERDQSGGEAVMAELMARFIVNAGSTHVVLCDLHSPVVKKYFNDVDVRVIDPNPVFWEVLKDKDLSDYVVLTPDLGREDVASQFARHFNLSLVEARKSRPNHDQVKSHGIKGNVKGKRVIIREDEISTAGTIIETTREAIKKGAREVVVMATHGVAAGGAIQKLKRIREIAKIYITDSIYFPWEKRIEKIEVLSLDSLIAKAVQKIHAED